MRRRRDVDTPPTLTQTLPLTLIDQDAFCSILFDGEVEKYLLELKVWPIALEVGLFIGFQCYLEIKITIQQLLISFIFCSNKFPDIFFQENSSKPGVTVCHIVLSTSIP
jgi:hypothetical protein